MNATIHPIRDRSNAGEPRTAVVLFVAAEALSLFGNAAIGIVLPWLVLTRTGDASVTGLVAAAAGISAAVVSFPGGWLIDRFGRKRMSIIADCGSALSVAALALIDQWTGLTVFWFVLLGVTGALFDIPGMTARETLMAGVSRTSGVPLERVAAVRQGIFGLTFLGGPALAGLLLSRLDPIDVVWITAACSAGAALCTAGLRLRAEAPSVEPDAAGSVQSVLRRDRAIPSLLVFGFVVALVIAPLVSILMPAHFQGMDRPEWFGWSMSAFAVGTMLGAVLYAVLSSRSRRVTYLLAIALYTAGLAGICTLTGFWPVAGGAALLGVGNGMLAPVFLVYFSEQVPEQVRGRVLSVFNTLALLATPIGLAGTAFALTAMEPGRAAWLLFAVWVVAAAYAMTSKGLASFATATRDAGDADEQATVGVTAREGC